MSKRKLTVSAALSIFIVFFPSSSFAKQDQQEEVIIQQSHPKKIRDTRDKEKWLSHSRKGTSVDKARKKRVKRKYYD